MKGLKFLRKEYADMVDKQQWIVLPAKMIKDMFGLRLSPLGLVPQRGRRDRMISDYSYYDVNQETLNIAPNEAMQFGRTLWRLLFQIHHANDHFGPVYMSKIDLSDGFYRLWLRPEDTHRLAVLFPSRPDEPKLVGIPLANPMGHVSSPPNFSACTETVADLANAALADPIAREEARSTPHRLDVVSESLPDPTDDPTPIPSSTSEVSSAVDKTNKNVTIDTAKAEPTSEPSDHPSQIPSDGPSSEPSGQPSFPPAAKQFRRPVAAWDIYVDDYCGITQGNRWQRRMVKRILFQALDKIFRPLDDDDTPFRQEPVSIKKCKKGDATWATTKIILGWFLDTIAKTISLPDHRAKRLHEILDSISPEQRWIATKSWHKIIGELRSMSIALPGCTGLFSILQEAFRHEEKNRH